jgi:hypothetical protein
MSTWPPAPRADGDIPDGLTAEAQISACRRISAPFLRHAALYLTICIGLSSRLAVSRRLELLFCAHHNKQYSSVLANIAVEIQDETIQLACCA